MRFSLFCVWDSGKAACRRVFSLSPSVALTHTHTIHTQSAVKTSLYTPALSDPFRNPPSLLCDTRLFPPTPPFWDEDFLRCPSIPQLLLYFRKSITTPTPTAVYFQQLIPATHQRFIFGSETSWRPSVPSQLEPGKEIRSVYVVVTVRCGKGREQPACGVRHDKNIRSD